VALVDAGRDGASAERGLGAAADLDLPALALVSDQARSSAMLAAGARGAVLRSADATTLWAALVAVRQGLVVLDEAFAADVVASAAPAGASGAAAPPAGARSELAAAEELTAREREVLALLARGLSNKEIARALAISDHTAKFHASAILAKLGAESRTEAVVIAVRLGLVAL
jgi:DNA-binding NarL/FixJ family response regulator